ncbi:MAG: hypothetical protein SF162_11160 [bacterium]|nr:hypothetical protein [bacterium]
MRRRLLIAALLCCVVPAAVAAQEADEAAADRLDIATDFYNHADGWHVFIPTGWDDRSTPDYALFTADAGTIFAVGYRGDSAEQAAADALRTAEITVDAPYDVREVNLVNGTWTQQLYNTDAGPVTLHTQQYEGMQYVLIFRGSPAAHPLILMREGVLENPELAAQAISEAITLAADTQASPDVTETRLETEGRTIPVTIQTFADGRNAIALPRGEAVYIVTGTGDLAALNAASTYFTVLNDFFITPETTPYLILGIAVAAAVMLILIGSMMLRRRNLLKDEAALRELTTA